MKVLETGETKRRKGIRITACILAFVMVFGMFLQVPVLADAAVSCKTLCQAALKKTGGESKLKYQSAKAEDLAVFPHQTGKKSHLLCMCVMRKKHTASV